MKRPIRMTLDRDDLVTVLYALESVIEDYKYDGGLVLAENEMSLHDRLEKRLRDYDLKRVAAVPVPATAETDE